MEFVRLLDARRFDERSPMMTSSDGSQPSLLPLRPPVRLALKRFDQDNRIGNDLGRAR